MNKLRKMITWTSANAKKRLVLTFLYWNFYNLLDDTTFKDFYVYVLNALVMESSLDVEFLKMKIDEFLHFIFPCSHTAHLYKGHRYSIRSWERRWECFISLPFQERNVLYASWKQQWLTSIYLAISIWRFSKSFSTQSRLNSWSCEDDVG
jgi:hypothetical protein